jgi:telomerase reverse transcriptase
LVRRLKVHLGAQLVRLGGTFLMQTRGVAQGGVLSSLLCTLLYGDMERTHNLAQRGVGGGGGRDSLLLRWVDDFLFLSLCPARAVAFAAQLAAGFPEYGAAFSVAKTALNFDAWPSADDPRARGGGLRAPLPRNELTLPCGRTFVRWCGLLINCETAEFQADQSRLRGGGGLAASVGAPGRDGAAHALLRGRVRVWLRPKALDLLWDAQLNGAETAALNVFQAVVVAAAKLRVYAQQHLRLAGGAADRLLIAVVGDAVNYITRLVRARQAVAAAAAAGRSLQDAPLRGAGPRFLALTAFQRAFERRPSRHGRLLAWLTRELRRRAVRAAALRASLRAAVQPLRSEHLMRDCV